MAVRNHMHLKLKVEHEPWSRTKRDSIQGLDEISAGFVLAKCASLRPLISPSTLRSREFHLVGTMWTMYEGDRPLLYLEAHTPQVWHSCSRPQFLQAPVYHSRLELSRICLEHSAMGNALMTASAEDSKGGPLPQLPSMRTRLYSQ